MSWQLASIALVLGSLGMAFWWYERSHPPAKLIAIIATLAALAALGRDAFAAIPDVKPITAIVLVSGFAFGARPGFAIGAIAGLSSNVLLGEGPWTPWQMLGWGLVGVLGAALGRLLGRREPPRLVLALACAGAAEAFNLVVDAYTWTGTGNRSLASFGLVLGQALVFDVTHVVASFLFGLAFGPMLLRMLARVQARLSVQWRPASAAAPATQMPQTPRARITTTTLLVLALGACTILLGACASAATPSGTLHPLGDASAAPSLAPELGYLARAQDADGGFGAAPGQASSELYSAWAAIGIAATGRNPLAVRRDGHTVLDALRAEASTLQGAGDLERTILALRACGASPRSLPGGDPVRRLLALRSRNGSYEGLVNLTAFAVLALRAAGYGAATPAVSSAAGWLVRQQEGDGGFGFGPRGAGSDVDDSAAVVQALVAAGRGHQPAVTRAVRFILGAQNLDGGFPQELGGGSNAQSTAWAVQALLAAGRDVQRVTRAGSRSPLGYLRGLVAPDGSVRYSSSGRQTPVWVTAQALTALAGRPLPIVRQST